MSGRRDRARTLAAMIDEFAPIGWRRDPAWWALVAGTVALERRGQRTAPAYLLSDGEPGADTFMAATTPAPDSTGAWIGWAIASAHAGRDAIARCDGAFPDQPLAVTIERAADGARAAPVTDLHRVGFAIGDALVVATLDPRGPTHEAALARRLAEVIAGARPPPVSGPPPLLVVAIGDDTLDRAHHGHRRAWTGRGGPWLGIARVGALTVVSTCHMIVDGFGHAELTRAIVHATEPLAGPEVEATMPPLVAGPGERLDVAWRSIAAPARALPLAHGLGVVLHRRRGAPAAPRSPSFQLPVAPGAIDDPTRFARRVRPAWLSVRFSDGRPEPLEVFAARAKRAIAREAAGAGLASRLLAALAGVPAPLAIKRGVVGAGPARWTRGPADALAGDACLSVLATAVPLIAVSAPPPQIPRSRGSAVVTIATGVGGALAAIATTGPWPAAALLDEWLTEVSSAGGAPPASR